MNKFLPSIFTFFLHATASLFAQNFSSDYIDGKIWVKLKEGYTANAALNENLMNIDLNTLPFLKNIITETSSKNAIEEIKLSKPFYRTKSGKLQNTYQLNFNDYETVNEKIRKLMLAEEVEYAEQIPLNKTTQIPNDPAISYAWHLNKINAWDAWDYTTGNSSVVVAIVDNAIDTNHPDLKANLWSNAGEIANNNIDDDNNGYVDDVCGFDVADNDNNPNPPLTSWEHGTHVAGIACARSNNGVGIPSIGYNISLMPVKATNVYGYVTHGYDGVVYAIDAGADVINMSFGGYAYNQTAQNIMDYGHSKGIVLVASAGNNNMSQLFYPAAFNHVIAVANTNGNDLKYSDSNFGTWVDISAPGASIISTLPGNSYGIMSGTSMSSPMVAGLCGLMLSLNPSLTPDEILNCLKSSADNINAQNPSYIGKLGAGRINASAALACVSSLGSISSKAIKSNYENAIKSRYDNNSHILEINIDKKNLLGEKTFDVKVINLLGQMPYSIEATGNDVININMSAQSMGVYYLQVTGQKGMYSNKFVKN